MQTIAAEYVVEDTNIIQLTNKTNIGDRKFGTYTYYGEQRTYTVANCILPHINADALINNLQDVYALIARKCSNDLVKIGEKRWSDILPAPINAELEKIGFYPLAFALITEYNTYVAIELLEAIVPNDVYTQTLVERIEDKFGKPAVY